MYVEQQKLLTEQQEQEMKALYAQHAAAGSLNGLFNSVQADEFNAAQADELNNPFRLPAQKMNQKHQLEQRDLFSTLKQTFLLTQDERVRARAFGSKWSFFGD
jgi:hypothetical protein